MINDCYFQTVYRNVRVTQYSVGNFSFVRTINNIFNNSVKFTHSHLWSHDKLTKSNIQNKRLNAKHFPKMMLLTSKPSVRSTALSSNYYSQSIFY